MFDHCKQALLCVVGTGIAPEVPAPAERIQSFLFVAETSRWEAQVWSSQTSRKTSAPVFANRE